MNVGSIACFYKKLKEVLKMPEDVQTQEAVVEVEAVVNIKNFSTIPNSNSEFCVYTYKAEYETYSQIFRSGFFNPAYSFLNVGDTIRVFRFDLEKNLTHLLQFVVMDVDKINKTVKVATIANHNLVTKVI